MKFRTTFFLTILSSATALSASAANAPDTDAHVRDTLVLERMFREYPALAWKKDTVVIRITGDAMMHRAQIDNALESDGSYSFHGCLDGISRLLKTADISVANMEFSLGGKPYAGYPSFSAPDSFADYMKDVGVNLFLTANNHILDRGHSGLSRTLGKYAGMREKYGTMMTGSGRDASEFDEINPLTVVRKGVKIAFINFTYGTNHAPERNFPSTFIENREKIAAAFDRAEERGADIIIVLPHWGKEYDTRHSEEQEKLAIWLAGMGADIIVGAHPHVVQDIQTIETRNDDGSVREVPVIYSCGNLISNMSAENTQAGLMVEIGIETDVAGHRILPLKYRWLWCSLPGRLGKCHKTVQIKEYENRKEEWSSGYEYDKMMATYRRMMNLTGIKD